MRMCNLTAFQSRSCVFTFGKHCLYLVATQNPAVDLFLGNKLEIQIPGESTSPTESYTILWQDLVSENTSLPVLGIVLYNEV